MMFLVFLVLFWSLVFGLLMFRKYYVAILVIVFLLCPFSVKISIKKSISLWRSFSVHLLYSLERKPLNTPIAICSAMFPFSFICTFDKEFTKKKTHLINKFEILKNNTRKKSKEETTVYIKQAVINLTNTELTEEQNSLLNFEPNFILATKRIPFMDISSDIETCTIDLENRSKETDAECLRQKVSRILNRNLNIKLWDNLSKPQRQALVQMKNNKDTTVYPFDKGSAFVVLSEKNVTQKLEEQLGKAKKNKK